MNINDENDNPKAYKCSIEGTTNNSHTELSCDTSNDPLRTAPKNIHLSSGNSSDTVYQIQMADPDDDVNKISSIGGSGNRYYSKSSSGLSGGAIAGIVIACVVALAAASIAAIMLRKPAPPIDNTTVVNLKSENI